MFFLIPPVTDRGVLACVRFPAKVCCQRRWVQYTMAVFVYFESSDTEIHEEIARVIVDGEVEDVHPGAGCRRRRSVLGPLEPTASP